MKVNFERMSGVYRFDGYKVNITPSEFSILSGGLVEEFSHRRIPGLLRHVNLAQPLDGFLCQGSGTIPDTVTSRIVLDKVKRGILKTTVTEAHLDVMAECPVCRQRFILCGDEWKAEIITNNQYN